MAINNTTKKILKALSFDSIEVEASRNLADLKTLDLMKPFYNKVNEKVYNGDHEVLVRIFFPSEKAVQDTKESGSRRRGAMLFFHGGGWATDSIDNYERICAMLADATNQYVVAVEYRLAPENKFPAGLEDCYAVAKSMYTGEFILNIKPEDITLIGDSAGGNLCAALSLMARDRGEFVPKRQILIYPATYNDYTDNSPFDSVRENGSDYVLTQGKMQDYINLYVRDEADKQNPYFAPYLAEDLRNQPDTLVLTSEFDLLRDEGEAYGHRLAEAGNYVEIHRIPDAVHGFFALGMKHFHVQESFEYINSFLRGKDREA